MQLYRASGMIEPTIRLPFPLPVQRSVNPIRTVFFCCLIYQRCADGGAPLRNSVKIGLWSKVLVNFMILNFI